MPTRPSCSIRALYIPSVLAGLALFCAFPALAGFGITPPYVKNASLTRNSRYEQQIILVRSDPLEDLQGEVTIDVPKANSWISVDKGARFILKKGEKQFPIVVRVAVPKDASFGTYRGNIRVRVFPPQGPESGSVGIALGAQIDVALGVIDKKILDFTVRKVSVGDLNEGHTFLWMYFPAKIRFTMQLENTGNIPAAPSQVIFDIRDTQGRSVETTHNSNAIKKVDPFDTKETLAELPSRLKAGSYQATYKIYKEDLISQEGVLHLSILPYGTLAGDTGYGIMGLGRKEKAILLLIGLVFAGVLWIIVRLVRNKMRKGRNGTPFDGGTHSGELPWPPPPPATRQKKTL